MSGLQQSPWEWRSPLPMVNSQEQNPGLSSPSFSPFSKIPPFWLNLVWKSCSQPLQSVTQGLCKVTPREHMPKTSWYYPATGALYTVFCSCHSMHPYWQPIYCKKSFQNIRSSWRHSLNIKYYNARSLCHQGCLPEKFRLTHSCCCCQAHSPAWHDPILQKILFIY